MAKLISGAEYLPLPDGSFKLVVRTRVPTFKTSLTFDGREIPDAFNLDEPYDRKGHVFYLDGEPDASAVFCCRVPKLSRALRSPVSV